MKREKIIIIVSGVVCASLIAITLILNKRLEKKTERVLELEYDQTKTQIKIKNLELKYMEEIEVANMYKSKYENYGRTMDSIYINNLNVGDKALIEYFNKRYWKKDGTYKSLSHGFKN